MRYIERVRSKIPITVACAALAFTILPGVTGRVEAAGENAQITCGHTNIKLETFYTLTVDFDPSSGLASDPDTSSPSKEESSIQPLSLDVVLHPDNDAISRRLNARLLGRSIGDVLRSSERNSYGLIELRPDPVIAEVTKQYHDYIGSLAGQESEKISDLTLLMCNPNICKVEVGHPILLGQRPVYLLFGLPPEHLKVWRSVALALISEIGRWCASAP